MRFRREPELVYFHGCPSYLIAEERLRRVLAERAVAANVDLVRVDTDE